MADPVLRYKVRGRLVDDVPLVTAASRTDAEIDAEMLALEHAEAPFPQLRECRVCGCYDAGPCAGGCTWIEDDLCSRCGGP